MTTALPEKFDIIGGEDSDVPFWTLFTGMVIVNFYYWGTNQAIIQRALGAKNLKEGQKELLIAAFIKILGPIIVVLPGVIAFYIFNGDIGNADEAYPTLVKKVLPTAFIGFFAAVLFGAILSSFNSALNSSVTLFGLDFYKEYINKDANERQVVRAGKSFGILLAIFSMAIAPLLYGIQGGVFTYLQELNGTHSVPILAIIIVGIFSKRVTGRGANIALVFSVVVYLILMFVIRPICLESGIFFPHFLHLMGIIFVLAVIIMFSVSAIKPRESDYVQEYTKQVDITQWKYLKPVGYSICSLVILLYIYICYKLYNRLSLQKTSDNENNPFHIKKTLRITRGFMKTNI